MRNIHQMLFHGNGKTSKWELTNLVLIIAKGHELLSGIQQSISVTTKEYKEAEEELKDVCRDVLASFGYSDKGLEWEELPYPHRIPKVDDTQTPQ